MIEQKVKERGILFSAPMIRAILDGSKTQTRCVIKPQPTAQLYSVNGGPEWTYPDPRDSDMPDWGSIRLCPYGAVGDRLWARESWNAVNTRGVFWDQLKPSEREGQAWAAVLYKATEEKEEDRYVGRWCPSIHMPRWASRITLVIESIRAERLQDITEDDAKAEGVKEWAAAYCSRLPEDELYARAYFELMWGHGDGRRYPWESNPFCWVIAFAPTRGQEG